MMKVEIAASAALTAVALLLGGCATDVEPDDAPADSTEAEDAPVVAPDEESYSADTQASKCTTSKSCDKDYCCTTTTCRFSVLVECVPAPKLAR